MDLFSNFFFTLIMVTVAALLAVFAYTQKKNNLFYIGLVACLIASIGIVAGYEYYIYTVSRGNMLSLIVIGAWLMAIVFLILSRTASPQKSEQDVTDSYLDEIINAEDEEWDID